MKGQPTGVAQDHLEEGCPLGEEMWPAAFLKVRKSVEGMAKAAATKAINLANEEKRRVLAAKKMDMDWRANKGRRGYEGSRR